MQHHTLKSALMIERTKVFLERVFPSPRNFSILLWNDDELPGGLDPVFTLVLNHQGALRRMFSTSIELSLGEAYIYGDFDIIGNIYAAYGLIESLNKHTVTPRDMTALIKALRRLPNTGPARSMKRKPLKLDGELHSLSRDREAVRFHYDVGNDFYSMWLDRQMQYSCGYFPTGAEDLDTAQERKIEHICRKLRLNPGERLLDIGCGWGGLALAAAQKYGVSVLGVTLSERQAAYGTEQSARLGLSERVRIEMRDYRDMEEGSFDKIVSVGMFEHVGRSHLPEYFSQVYRLLKSGGLFLNHGISRRSRPADLALLQGLDGHERASSTRQTFFERKVLGTGSFSQHYIFPDGELVPVSEANLIAEMVGFEVRDVENLREHYALTLRNWVRRLEEHQEEAMLMVGEPVYRTWQLYMSYCALGFEAGRTSVHQSLLAKPLLGKVDLPMCRADLYE